MITFTWERQDAENLLKACEGGGVLSAVVRYVPKGGMILDSGCGLAQYVRSLKDKGWSAVGLEHDESTVHLARSVWPDLEIVQGDAEHSPFPDESFDAVISLGVVEHFVAGPGAALAEMRRVLKPGGIAVITVPCLNTVRRMKRAVGWPEIASFPRAVAGRLLKGKPKPVTRFNKTYRYAVYPSFGKFFEYRMTTEEFRKEVESAGFLVLEHHPEAVIDGVYHDLNPFGWLIGFRDWKFYPTPLARWMNAVLSRHLFFHCHMQRVVARKAVIRESGSEVFL